MVRGAERQATNVNNIHSCQKQPKHRGEEALQQRRHFPVQQRQKQEARQYLCGEQPAGVLAGSPSHRIAETSLKGQHSGRPETALHACRFVPRLWQDSREVPHPTEGGCPV